LYTKLFPSMFDGTLVTKGPWQALVTFQQMLILADETGVVDMTPGAISNRTTIPLDIIQTGIAALEQPDPDSRTPDLEGRRIVRLDEHRTWGWQIVNYQQFREIRDKEERRAYQREWLRNKRKQVSTDDDSCRQPSTGVDDVDQSRSRSRSRSSTCNEAIAFDASPPAPPTDAKTRKKGNGTPLGQRLPADWRLPDEWKEWAIACYPDLDPQKVVRMSLEFRDYWGAVPGAKGRKTDWLMTWRNNIRRKMGDA